MFCRRCYADLHQAFDSRCMRCDRSFDPNNPSSYLPRPFPSRRRIIVHTVTMLILATIVSAIVAAFISMAQMKFIHSNH
jgi:hypothetical protein